MHIRCMAIPCTFVVLIDHVPNFALGNNLRIQHEDPEIHVVFREVTDSFSFLFPQESVGSDPMRMEGGVRGSLAW